MNDCHSAAFLDFDGVLFDTVREAYWICTCVLTGCDDPILDFDTQDYTLFERYRYLNMSAWNYYYLFQVLHQDDVVGAYQDAIKTADPALYGPFEEAYFKARYRVSTKHAEYWFSLHRIHSFLEKIKPLIVQYPTLFHILTTKDKPTIVKLLHSHNIGFEIDNILDRDYYNQYRSKARVLRAFREIKHWKNAFFIDDCFEHLQHCESISDLELHHALWGYVSKEVQQDNSDYCIDRLNLFIKRTVCLE